MSAKDGGPAYPRQLIQIEHPYTFDPIDLRAQSGMSLRDWFAGQAPPMPNEWLTGWCTANPSLIRGHYWTAAIAAYAYFYADAMLAERMKGPTDD